MKKQITVGIPFSTAKYGYENKSYKPLFAEIFLKNLDTFLKSEEFEIQFLMVTELHPLNKSVGSLGRLGSNETTSILQEERLKYEQHMTPILNELRNKGFKVTEWFYSVDTNACVEASGTHERLKHIMTGRNLINQFCVDNHSSHLLGLDSDVEIQDPKFLTRMLAFNHSFVSGLIDVFAFCQHLKFTKEAMSKMAAFRHRLAELEVKKAPEPWINTSLVSGGFILLSRELFQSVPWRIDLDRGWTEDSCLCQDAARKGHPIVLLPTLIAKHPSLQKAN